MKLIFYPNKPRLQTGKTLPVDVTFNWFTVIKQHLVTKRNHVQGLRGEMLNLAG